MFEIADLSHVWVQAKIYEDQVDLVHVGQEVEATVESFPGQVFQGKVAFIDPALDPGDTHDRTSVMTWPTAGHKLRPGMFATVTLKTPVGRHPVLSDPTSRRLIPRCRIDAARRA